MIATEFVIIVAKVQFGVDLTTSLRDYVFCDQVFDVGFIDPTTFFSINGGQPQLVIANPNVKVSCNACVFAANTNNSTNGVAVFGSPTIEQTQPLVPGFIPDPSGLVVDGPTITRSSQDTLGDGISMTNLLRYPAREEGLPMQFRNIEVRDAVLSSIIFFTSAGDAPLSVEVSNVVVKVCR